MEHAVYEPYYVARQPILDRKGRRYGYELLFRGGLDEQFARIVDPEAASLSVASCGYLRSRESPQSTERMFINYPESLLLDGVPRALPATGTVVEVLEGVAASDEVMAAVRALKEDGYMLALDDYDGGQKRLLEYADIVKVDVLGRDPGELARVVDSLRSHSCALLAERVENEQVHAQCMDLGFELFQGFFFARPENLAGRKLSAHMNSRLEVLRRLEDPDLEAAGLAEIIAADVSLSYRLLRFLNSAAFSFQSEIRSIRQAVLLLGLRQARYWLRMVILSDLNPQQGGGELFHAALRRSRFLECLGREGGAPRSVLALGGEGLGLLGLFSMLEPMLRVPMAEIVAKLPIHEDVADALLGKPGPAGDCLHLAVALENADWDAVDRLGAGLELDADLLRLCQAQALEFATRHMSPVDAETSDPQG